MTRACTTPEGQHLVEQEELLAELTDVLATKETEFATIGAEFARFRTQFLRRIAPLYAELDGIESEIARLLAAEEHTAAAQSKAAEAAARFDESTEALMEAGDPDAGAPAEKMTPIGPDPELRALYREAAKKIHPDLAGDDEELARRTALMAALNAAYEAGDVEALQRILDGEATRPEAIVGDDIASNLVRVIRKLAQVRGRLADLDSLIDAFEGDALFALFDQAREVWQIGEDPLAEDEASLRRRIASAQARLATLTSDRTRLHPSD